MDELEHQVPHLELEARVYIPGLPIPMPRRMALALGKDRGRKYIEEK